MNTNKFKDKVIVKAGMLIRKPTSEVFEAFINPDVTTKFWFTKSSGKLEAGKEVTWTWEMYGISAQVNVKEVEENKRILIEWGDPGAMTTVEWTFIPHEDNSTYIQIINRGFEGDDDSVITQALDSTGGFTTVLDGAKAWLEHNINLNLILDKFPKGLSEPGDS